MDAAPTPVRWLVVAAERVTSMDITAADILEELDQILRAAGIELCFAKLKDLAKDKLKRFGLFAQLGEELFYQKLSQDAFSGLGGTMKVRTPLNPDAQNSRTIQQPY